MVAPEMAEEPETRKEHPNRRKAASKLTRALVVLLLLASVVLMLIVTFGGWATLAGAKPVQIAYILIYAVLAFFVLRWSRGVLPLIAALAIALGIFAAISAPEWFSRDASGFTDPGLSSSVLGLVCAVLVPVQVALIIVSMGGFRQAWNIEVERPVDEDRSRGGRSRRDSGPGATAAPA
jgi:presenilin-like A22 family membrane protease